MRDTALNNLKSEVRMLVRIVADHVDGIPQPKREVLYRIFDRLSDELGIPVTDRTEPR